VKKFYPLILVFLGLLFSCRKENNNTHSVQYQVIMTTPGSGAYTLRYSLQDGTFRSEGPITSETWISENLNGYKKGSIVSLYLDSPGGTYEMSIYVDGQLSSHASADGGVGEQLLEASIPN
jgi:hypothetical protein